jgi:hypothetical protein
MDLRFDRTLHDLRACAETPLAGHLGDPNRVLLDPGNPDRSLLPYRMRIVGAGAMPPIGRKTVDTYAVARVDDWVRGIAACD